MRLILILLFSISLAHAEPSLSVGDTATNWTLETSDAKSINYYQDSENKVSVILFWASWCPYCERLMPHLQDVYKQYESEGLRFYALDIFEDGDIDPVQYFEKKGFTYALLMLADLVAEDYSVKGTPGLFVVDKNKKIIYKRKSGADNIEVKEKISLLIKQALAE
jgi:thiol-disulfide isomerase/thioredoxin